MLCSSATRDRKRIACIVPFLDQQEGLDGLTLENAPATPGVGAELVLFHSGKAPTTTGSAARIVEPVACVGKL